MKTVLFLCFSLACATTLQAISVDEIIANHLEAMGGESAIRKLTSLKVAGTMDVQGMKSTFRMFYKDNVKMRMEIDMMGSTMVQAFDGTTAWSINPMQGTDPVKSDDAQVPVARQQARIVGDLVDAKANGLTLALVGTVDVDGMTAYKISAAPAEGDTTMYFIDAITWLPIKVESAVDMMGNMVVVERNLGNFKPVAGVMLPMEVSVSSEGQTFMTMTWTSAEPNVPLDDSLFAFPSATDGN